MDTNMMFEAAREGNLEVLSRAFQENPSILADIKLISLSESILHVATKSGQLSFVHELMKMDPDMAHELNKDGFRPLDIAVIIGKVAIVKTMLSFDRDLGLLKGRDNRSCLHYAAVKGRVEVIEELMSQCPDGIEDVSVHGETALHLAVKNYQLDAFTELVKWMERLEKMKSIINVQDGDGNSVLHLAVSTKQYTCLHLLLERGIEVNVRNNKGLTALDVSDIVIQDCYDGKIRQALQNVSATRSTDQTISQQQIQLEDTNNHVDGSESRDDYFEYFRFKMSRDSPSDTRNAMLVVAALIVSITFQAALNPPSGLFNQSSIRVNSTSQPLRLSAFNNDFMFLTFNTVGFSAAIIIIYYLTMGFPLYRELYASLFSMSWTYGASFVVLLRDPNVQKNVKLLAYALLIITPFLVSFMRCLPMKGAWNFVKRRATRNHPLPVRI